MRTSNLIIIQPPKNLDKLEALKAFLKALKIKFEIAPDNEIPIEHQNLVLERIKNSKEEDLLNWDDIKDDFDGI
jgi:adenylate kinase family enzyme